ncbi:MAG: methyl-accepting chemotaxis protein [Thermodesulfobacteria bacterium]|nr:methyl-accepting chemotaxis protein [Thermodesulfobacteriota bacterium]
MDYLFSRFKISSLIASTFVWGIACLTIICFLSYANMKDSLQGFEKVSQMLVSNSDSGKDTSSILALERIKADLFSLYGANNEKLVAKYLSSAKEDIKSVDALVSASNLKGQLHAFVEESARTNRRIFNLKSKWKGETKTLLNQYASLRKKILEAVDEAEFKLVMDAETISSRPQNEIKTGIEKLLNRDYPIVSTLKDLFGQFQEYLLIRAELGSLEAPEYMVPLKGKFKAASARIESLINALEKLPVDKKIISVFKNAHSSLASKLEGLFDIRLAILEAKKKKAQLVQELASITKALDNLSRNLTSTITSAVSNLAAKQQEQLDLRLKIMASILGVCILFAITLGFSITRFLKQRFESITAILHTMFSRISTGNFVFDDLKKVKGKDEIASIQNMIFDTVVRIGQILKEVSSGSHQVLETTSHLDVTANNMANAAGQTEEVANDIKELVDVANEYVSRVTSSIEEVNSAIDEVIEHVRNSSADAVNAEQRLTDVKEAANELVSSSEQIGEITKLIGSIAEQTNLLALNATIEAARAGEAGKGFAVVANEVKELAKETGGSVEEIGKIVSDIQNGVKKVSETIDHASSTIAKIAEESGHVEQSIESEKAAIDEIRHQAEETVGKTSLIVEKVKQIVGASRNTTELAHEVKDISKVLKGVGDRLHKALSQFNLKGRKAA